MTWPDVHAALTRFRTLEPDWDGEGSDPPPPDGEIVQRSTVLIQRGLPSVVRCTLAEWMGDVCKNCWGEGWRANHGSDHPIIDAITCPTCHGSGRTPGIGPRLAQAWPVVEVRTEKVPQAYPAEKPDEYGWCHRRPNEPFNIPQEIWELLEGGTRDGQHDAWIDYPTEPAARAALSAALIRWARSQAI